MALELTASPYKDPLNHNCLVTINKNELAEAYPSYAIGTQKNNLGKAIKKCDYKYPNYETIYKKAQDPNSIKTLQFNGARVRHKLPRKSLLLLHNRKRINTRNRQIKRLLIVKKKGVEYLV